MKLHVVIDRPTRFDVIRQNPEEFIKGVFIDKEKAKHFKRSIEGVDTAQVEDVHQGYVRTQGLYIEEINVEDSAEDEGDKITEDLLYWHEVSIGPKSCLKCRWCDHSCARCSVHTYDEDSNPITFQRARRTKCKGRDFELPTEGVAS